MGSIKLTLSSLSWCEEVSIFSLPRDGKVSKLAPLSSPSGFQKVSKSKSWRPSVLWFPLLLSQLKIQDRNVYKISKVEKAIGSIELTLSFMKLAWRESGWSEATLVFTGPVSWPFTTGCTAPFCLVKLFWWIGMIGVAGIGVAGSYPTLSQQIPSFLFGLQTWRIACAPLHRWYSDFGGNSPISSSKISRTQWNDGQVYRLSSCLVDKRQRNAR